MTPDDVAAIRARYGNPHSGDIRALCDALELTLTRVDRLDDMLKQQVLVTEQRVEILRERAERAEAALSAAIEGEAGQ